MQDVKFREENSKLIQFARLHLAMAIYQSALYGEMQSCGEAFPRTPLKKLQ